MHRIVCVDKSPFLTLSGAGEIACWDAFKHAVERQSRVEAISTDSVFNSVLFVGNGLFWCAWCVHLCVYVCLRMCVHMCPCVAVSGCVYVGVDMCECVWMCVYTCGCVWMFVCLCMYTHPQWWECKWL